MLAQLLPKTAISQGHIRLVIRSLLRECAAGLEGDTPVRSSVRPPPISTPPHPGVQKTLLSSATQGRRHSAAHDICVHCALLRSQPSMALGPHNPRFGLLGSPHRSLCVYPRSGYCSSPLRSWCSCQSCKIPLKHSPAYSSLSLWLVAPSTQRPPFPQGQLSSAAVAQ